MSENKPNETRFQRFKFAKEAFRLLTPISNEYGGRIGKPRGANFASSAVSAENLADKMVSLAQSFRLRTFQNAFSQVRLTFLSFLQRKRKRKRDGHVAPIGVFQ